GEWWTAFYEGDATERESLLTSERAAPAGPKRKRAPRRGPRKAGAPATTGSTGEE
ncbi:MAG: poly(A) polymerase, partial [Massilia sp.]|nr:poly(A) polymerase [Massilia sp.]